MFAIAILIGIYSYLLFALGLLGFFYNSIVIIVSIVFVSIILVFKKGELIKFNLKEKVFKFVKQRSKLECFLVLFLGVQVLVNLIGTLGPELGFDALWYHLVLPKIYLNQHRIVHIPGSLLYYSDIPKLIELLYGAGLAFGSEIFAKLIHFSFGILSLFALYRLSRKFFSSFYSLLTLVIFYSNLVVGWMSITAYIDLARTFFEIMALWGFINWWEKKDKKWLIESAIMLGLSVSTKLLAIGSIFIFSILIVFYFVFQKKKPNYLFTNLFIYWFICLLIPLPWFVFSFIHTGNPIYPFFSSLYKVHINSQFINPFIHRSDSISIIYISLIFVPLIFNKLEIRLKIISLYSILGIVVWYLTQKSDTGRFILPYLPAFSILSVAILQMIKQIRVQYSLVGLVIFFSAFSIAYRSVTNMKYISVIIGKETKAHFLTTHLNFSFGDFYDTDNYFKTHLTSEDKVLFYGFHNLYYVNFPFTDSTFVKKGNVFNYIAVQNGLPPERFRYWNLIYQNSKTHVSLYSFGGQKWVY